MGAITQRLADLAEFRAERTAKEDFDDFWSRTLQQYKTKPLNGKRQRIETYMQGVSAHHITFEGFDDTPLHGWYLIPNDSGADRKHPCLVIYQGYRCQRGLPEYYATWLMMGYAVFIYDTRGQTGESGNRLVSGSGIMTGWMTQGIMEPDAFYGKALVIDAWKALEWVKEQPEIDPDRIAVYGTSQGGGMTLQMAALSDVPKAAVANVPNMCHLEFALMNSTGSVTEISEFLYRHPGSLDRILDTLSYFDNLNLAQKINIPVLYSAGLKDTICLPETIAAAYNGNPTASKRLCLYPFMGHDDGVDEHKALIYAFLREHL
ncbi:acetylxylan esterase [Paenibacillus puldeungensis]|uniref:Acetylxylan esterase n=1 Tax=Paenibacillus puldeungensis TaxID=696536 RepID=A0ABW3RRI7_9BACL